jgi:hypothetical protein
VSHPGTGGAARDRREFEHGKNRVRDFAVHVARPAIAVDPKLFGKGPARVVGSDAPGDDPTFADDLKLFATTFLAGFVVVFILIG